MQNLKGKCFLITGATSGFGEATVHRALAEGARVIAIGRRNERLEALRKRHGEALLPVTLDVSCREEVQSTLGSLHESWSNVAVLVNNAGLALGVEPAPQAALEDWERMIDTNIKGLLYVTQAILPGMLLRNCGHIINVGSMAGNYAYRGGNVYGGTKAFVKQFSLNLRADLLGTPIRVTNLEPGLAETEFSLVRLHGNAEAAKRVYEGTQPLLPEDVAEAVLWCASQPAHVNINRMEIMPVCQAPGGLAVHRQ